MWEDSDVTTEAELIEALDDHLAYERDMLGHTYTIIQTTQNQAEWNAHFESFCVHARNLYDFLRSDGKQGAFKARDYLPGHKPAACLAFNDIDTGILHVTNHRTRKQKIDLEQANRLAHWIDREWARWCGALPTKYSAHVKSDPVCKNVQVRVSGLQSATNAITLTSSRTTVVTTRNTVPKKDQGT